MIDSVYVLQRGREKLSSARLVLEEMGTGKTLSRKNVYTFLGSWNQENPGPHLVLFLGWENPAHLSRPWFTPLTTKPGTMGSNPGSVI